LSGAAAVAVGRHWGGKGGERRDRRSFTTFPRDLWLPRPTISVHASICSCGRSRLSSSRYPTRKYAPGCLPDGRRPARLPWPVAPVFVGVFASGAGLLLDDYPCPPDRRAH